MIALKDITGVPTACYITGMANILVKNIPEKLHNRLRRYAREQECTARLAYAALLTADGPLSRAPSLGILVENMRLP
jgi:hypothetical protein